MRTTVIVTGSRDLTDRDMVYETLSAEFEKPDVEEFTVVHGGARGADTFAAEWIKLMRPHYRVFEDRHESSHGKRDDSVINDEMIAAGADKVLAFYKGGADNTRAVDCVKKVRAIHIPAFIFTEE